MSFKPCFGFPNSVLKIQFLVLPFLALLQLSTPACSSGGGLITPRKPDDASGDFAAPSSKLEDLGQVDAKISSFDFGPPPTVVGTFVIPSGAAALAVDRAGAVWVTSPREDKITKFNASTTGEVKELGGKPASGIAIDYRDIVWIAATEYGGVVRYSGVGFVLDNIPVRPGPVSIAISRSDDVWVVCRDQGAVVRLSLDGRTQTAYDAGEGPYGIALVEGGGLWVTRPKIGMLLLNDRGARIQAFPLIGKPTDVATDIAGDIWVTLQDRNEIWHGKSNGSMISATSVGAQPLHIIKDRSDRFWVSNYGSNSVSELAPDGREMARVPVGKAPRGLAVGPDGDIWVANSGEDTIMRIHPIGI